MKLMKRTGIISGVCFGLLLVLFVATDPGQVPSFMLVLPFLLLFIMLFSLAVLMFQRRGMSTVRSVRVGAFCAGIPLLLLILQSIGQLTLRDVLTIGALFLISYFYISRTAVSS